MGIYRGAGGTGDAVNDASSEATLVQTLVAGATTQAANAATSATAAQSAATQANISKGLAADSATAAATSETNAATSATNAAASETAAETAQTAAETAQTAAETAKTAAELAETNAETAQAAAEVAQTAAETAETNAETSASNAATSETNAAASAASAAASYDNFDDRYLGPKSSNPTVDNDGNTLVTGALYFNTTAPEMRVWSGSGWSFIGSGGGAGVESFNTRTGAVTLSSSDVTTALTYTPLAPSAIGSTVQAYDANLTTLGAGGSSARSFLGLAIGTDVQAYDAQLADIAGLTPTDNSFIVGNGTNFVAEGASTARTSLGLGTAATTAATDYATAAQGTKADSALQPAAIGVSVQAYDADLDTWSGKTAPSGTVVGTSDSQTLTNKTLTNPTVNGFTGDTSVVNIGSGQVYKDTSGNVGLGSTPTAIGSYKVLEVNGTSGAYLSLRQGGTEYGNIYNNSTDGTTISAAGARNIIYQTNSAERMRITSAGGISFGSSGTAYGTSGQVLTSNGNAAPTWSSPSANLKTEIFTSSTTWTAPAGCTSIYAAVIGAGGGGSGSSGVSGVAGGYGGTGGVAIGYYTVVPGTAYTVTVGTGGTASNANNGAGTAGTSSSLGSLLSATGGGGGTSAQGSGANGVGTNGNIYTKVLTFYGAAPFVGEANRDAKTSSTAAVVWAASLSNASSGVGLLPGARGNGESNNTTSDATGGVGGAVFIQYIG